MLYRKVFLCQNLSLLVVAVNEFTIMNWGKKSYNPLLLLGFLAFLVQGRKAEITLFFHVLKEDKAFW